MSKFYIEKVEFANGSEKFEVKMETALGGSVLITERSSIEAARDAVVEFEGMIEVKRTVVQ